MISEILRQKIALSRLEGRRQYHLALQAGMNPTLLSGLLHGAVTVPLGDLRVIRLGASLGLAPDECFAAAPQFEKAAS